MIKKLDIFKQDIGRNFSALFSMQQIPLLIDYRGLGLSVLVSYRADETA